MQKIMLDCKTLKFKLTCVWAVYKHYLNSFKIPEQANLKFTSGSSYEMLRTSLINSLNILSLFILRSFA